MIELAAALVVHKKSRRDVILFFIFVGSDSTIDSKYSLPVTDFYASSSHDVYHAFSKCRDLTRQFLPREWQTMLGLHPSFAYPSCCKLKPALQVCHGIGVTCM